MYPYLVRVNIYFPFLLWHMEIMLPCSLQLDCDYFWTKKWRWKQWVLIWVEAITSPCDSLNVSCLLYWAWKTPVGLWSDTNKEAQIIKVLGATQAYTEQEIILCCVKPLRSGGCFLPQWMWVLSWWLSLESAFVWWCVCGYQHGGVCPVGTSESESSKKFPWLDEDTELC